MNTKRRLFEDAQDFLKNMVKASERYDQYFQDLKTQMDEVKASIKLHQISFEQHNENWKYVEDLELAIASAKEIVRVLNKRI